MGNRFLRIYDDDIHLVSYSNYMNKMDEHDIALEFKSNITKEKNCNVWVWLVLKEPFSTYKEKLDHLIKEKIRFFTIHDHHTDDTNSLVLLWIENDKENSLILEAVDMKVEIEF